MGRLCDLDFLDVVGDVREVIIADNANVFMESLKSRDDNLVTHWKSGRHRRLKSDTAQSIITTVAMVGMTNTSFPTEGPHLRNAVVCTNLDGQPSIEQGVECVVVTVSSVFGERLTTLGAGVLLICLSAGG